MKTVVVLGFKKLNAEKDEPEVLFLARGANKMGKANQVFTEAKKSGKYEAVEVYLNPRPRRRWRKSLSVIFKGDPDIPGAPAEDVAAALERAAPSAPEPSKDTPADPPAKPVKGKPEQKG